VNAMLLNEFLKEHGAFVKEQRKVEVQEKTIEEVKSGMMALTAAVKEQASQIQKVSAQLETSKFATGRIPSGRTCVASGQQSLNRAYSNNQPPCFSSWWLLVSRATVV
jgi:methyl-accepting chemotaxis protein